MLKILCLMHERNHVEPLIRSENELRQLGVDVTFVDCNSFAKATQYIKAEYDAILIHQVLLCDEVFASGPPVIILERIDGAQLAGGRPWIRQSAGIIKGYTFRNRHLNNRVRGRYFPHLLTAAGVGPTDNTRALAGLPTPPLSDDDLAKIHVGYGFPSYTIMRQMVDARVDFAATKTYDVHWVGTVEYQGTEIELHRKQAIDIVESWRGPKMVGAGRTRQYDDYSNTMRDSHCVLSPWGWGEPCFRDVEAMLSGAVLIKPWSDYVEGWPDVYASDKYLSCEPDFSDVHEIVTEVKSHWGEMRCMRENCRRMCVDAWQPQVIAEHMAQVFREIMA